MLEDSPASSQEIIDQLVRDTLPLGFIYWDTRGNGLGCSPNVVELFGLQSPKEVFEHWDSLSPTRQPNGYGSKLYFQEIVSQAHGNGKVVVEWHFQNIQGEQIPVELTCVRHSVSGNDFLVAYLRDQREEQTIFRNAEINYYEFISILRSCPICFAIISEDRFTFITPFMGNFLGVQVGDTFSTIIVDPKAAELLSKDPCGDDLISWMHITIRTQEGELKEMLAYSLCFDNPERSERIVWLVDITQSRKLELELKTAKDIAEANARAKSEFLANMSHEIRTPMNAIIGLTHLTLRTALTEQQTEYIEIVQQSAHILLRLINDILDFSKIEAGRMVLEYREFPIGSLISDISAVIKEPLQKKNLEFKIEIGQDMPPTVMGDSVRLHQVILNLLTNAIKFTESGSIRLNVEVVEADMLSVVLRFSVTDSGIGMTPIQVKGLFQPFSQASASTTRKFGGTGLGLAISKQIVTLMHGDISCQSEAGKGATFTFTARFGVPLEGEVVNVDESTEIRTDALLVGDYPKDQDVMKHYIELLGAKVYQCGATLSEFKEYLDTDRINAVDFIVFDFSDLRKDFIPIYTALQEKHLAPLPWCVVAEHPDLDAVLGELNIKDSMPSIKKPVIAGDLFNVAAKVAAHKEELHQKKMAFASQILSQNKDDVEIPESICGAKILLAEDNKINQMVARELLRVAGFETTVAENGRIAIEMLKKQTFDIVLMDIQMPEMDGFEATRIIRADEHFKDLPILAMTANAMSGDKELCLEAGMNDHIAKPIEPKLLYNALVKWIRK